MKILLAYDGSESAKHALERAAELASSNGHKLSVVTVAEPLPQFGRAGVMMVPEEEQERLYELSDAMAALRDKGVQAHAVERKGDAAEMIIDEAEKEHVDTIVMGHRGLNDVQRWLLGSVSSKVVEHAPCDVLVVR